MWSVYVSVHVSASQESKQWFFMQGPKAVSEEEKLSSGHLINLIDSPGHVDFCSEVKMPRMNVNVCFYAMSSC